MNEVDKIIGRNFIIGFFVPAIVLVAASAGILHELWLLPEWLRIDPTDPLKDSTFLALITIIAAFFLLAGNRNIFRALEGYWVFDLGGYLIFFQRWRFRRLRRHITELDNEFEQCLKEKKTFTKKRKRNKLMRMAVQRFPSTEEQLMFTSFGNAVKAFEDYPRVMYGFESINGWSRLNAVMPKSYQDTVGTRRAMTDFWVNLWFVSLLIIAEYLFIVIHSRPGLVHRSIPLAAIALSLFASFQARIAAEQWGEWVKGAFDVYLPVLREKWGYMQPRTMEGDRHLWQTLTRAIVYRDAASLDELDGLREPRLPSGETKNDGLENDESERDED